MIYSKIKDKCFAVGSVVDGYNGQRAQVGFYFDADSGKTVCVAECGFFISPIPQAIDESDALWLLSNHPSATGIVIAG